MNPTLLPFRCPIRQRGGIKPRGNSFRRRIGLIVTCVFIIGVAHADEGQLLAGAARVNLTPPLAMRVALGGYGERLSRPATGVHDAVWAKALVLTQGERKFALVTADVLAFPPQFKAAVVARLATTGWNANQILLLASHSHTSFDMMALHPGNRFDLPQMGIFHKELFERTAEQLAEVIRAAAQAIVPAQAGSANVTVPDRNRNRRSGLRTHDPSLTVTRVDTRSGQPLAVLVNWTAHPTFMDAEDMWFSGDWPGHLQRTLEALIGSNVVAMFYNGAEGDQSPTPPANVTSHWERAERYGREMGLEAWRVWEKIAPHEVTEFAWHTETIALPQITWHADFMKTGGTEYGLNKATIGNLLGALLPTQTHSTALRLGDLVILGVPGEMASELGLTIKAQAREFTDAKCVTIGGLADEWVSYILPATEWRKGGYEASVSFYGETLGDTVMAGVLRAARGLK
ncbi:MAG: neutral/alkaline non-lysosomal ceramidase N-terminal domain-containing protein [Verrucomicrobiae bacterium]|nr:neutral/alkaline non-lysosomal ceramidase N-terminal domain-containing protein [Verrucomicrobiae bacterium]